MDKTWSKSKSLLIVLLLCGFVFADANDVEFDGSILLRSDEQKVFWYNGDYFWSLAAAPALAEDVNYIWPHEYTGFGTPLIDIGSGILDWGAPLYIDAENGRVGIGAFPMSTETHTQVGTEDLSGYSSSLVKGHWKLNDNAASTTVEDSSDTGNDGTASANTSVLSTTGVTNNAFLLNGAGHKVTIPDNAAYDFTGSFTIALWAKPGRNDVIQYVLYRRASNNTSYQLWIYNRKWSFTCSTELASSVISSDDNASTSDWQFIVCSRDADYIMRMYVDADLQEQHKYLYGSLASSQPIILGAADTQWYFDGAIDNVMLFNTALTESNIDTLYDPSATARKPVFHVSTDYTPKNNVIELARFERTAEEGVGAAGIGLSLDFYLEMNTGASQKVGAFEWSSDDAAVGSAKEFALSVDMGGGAYRDIAKTSDARFGVHAYDENKTLYFNPVDMGGDRTLTISMGEQDRYIDFTGADEGDYLYVESEAKVDQDLTADSTTTAFAKLILTDEDPPTSASGTGITGQLAFDSKYLYRCIATNTWKRVEMSTWTDSYLLLPTEDKILQSNGDFIIISE